MLVTQRLPVTEMQVISFMPLVIHSFVHVQSNLNANENLYLSLMRIIRNPP